MYTRASSIPYLYVIIKNFVCKRRRNLVLSQWWWILTGGIITWLLYVGVTQPRFQFMQVHTSVACRNKDCRHMHTMFIQAQGDELEWEHKEEKEEEEGSRIWLQN
jgi:hypothetical protein